MTDSLKLPNEIRAVMDTGIPAVVVTCSVDGFRTRPSSRTCTRWMNRMLLCRFNFLTKPFVTSGKTPTLVFR